MDSGARLCLACGICCTGVLFSHAEIEEEELPRVVRRGLPIAYPDRRLPELRLPCTAHGPGGCGIYEDRPETCVGYGCKLLGRLKRGDLPLEEALASVERIRALVATVSEVLPPGGWFWGRAAALRAAPAPPSFEGQLRLARTWIELEVLQELLSRDLDERMAEDRATGSHVSADTAARVTPR